MITGYLGSVTPDVASGGGTLSGDVTITGDLTVQGTGGGYAYTEVITGDVQINGPAGTGAASAGVLVLSTAEETVRVGSVDQLGRIDFQAPSETGGSDAILVGASIHAVAAEDFSSTNNSTALVFSTGTTTVPIERMRIDQDGQVDIPGGILQVSQDTDRSENLLLYSRNTAKFSGTSNIAVISTTGCNALEIGNASNHPIHFASNNAVRMTIDGNSRISLSNNDSGTSNTIFGSSAGGSIASGGSYNVLIGEQSGAAINTNYGNIMIGWYAGNTADAASTNAIDNVYIGKATGRYMDDGQYNVAVGAGAMLGASTGNNATYNTAIGRSALTAITTGDSNVAVGSGAGAAITTDTRVVAIGANAYDAMDTSAGHDTTPANGSGNTAIGYNSMTGFTDANCLKNTAIGFDTMSQGTSHNPQDNVAVGFQSMRGINDGDSNTAVGSGALKLVAGGSNNVAIGTLALSTADAGESNNVAIGESAMISVNSASTSEKNIAIGRLALTGGSGVVVGNIAIGHLALVTTGSYAHEGTIAIGTQALTALTSGIENTVVGYNAGLAATTESQSTLIGYQAGYQLLDSSNNTFVGFQAGAQIGSHLAISNTFIGSLAGANGESDAPNDNVAIGNVAVGYKAMGDRTAADEAEFDTTYSVAIGEQALSHATSGAANVAIGYLTNQNMTAGEGNVAIGASAGQHMTTCEDNVVIGREAGLKLAHETSDKNTAIGRTAMGGGHNTYAGNTANNNVAIGYQAVGGTTGTSVDFTAAQNVGVGAGTMIAISTGTTNVAVGHWAGDAITTGTSNVIIGYNSDPSAATASNQICIGNDTQGIGNNYAVIGDGNITRLYAADDVGATLYAGSATVETSDERIKEDIVDASLGLDFIEKLRAVEYKKRQPKDYDESLKKELNWYKNGRKPRELDELDKDKCRTGFIAQEVGQVLQDINYADNNDIVEIDETNTQQMIAYSKLVPPLVKAVQELSAKVEELEAKLSK